MIKIENLKKTYKERCVLDIERLTVEQGETLAILGANGSGKTTLLRILAGTLGADEGHFDLPAPVLYLPQQSYAFRGNLVHNVLMGTKATAAEAEQLLDSMGLGALKEKKATSLSGGELQRLALCRLLIRPAKVLLLDEPTSACDAQGTALIADALADYQQKEGCAILLSTHEKEFAAACAQHTITLSDGKIQQD
ncbi:MAG: ABC transporter ATP-binding protein [Clostridia bacterium]|nr:ABC transporter ATP-binding protein [Clostridia bacterium]